MKRTVLVALVVAGCSGSNLNTSRGSNGETIVGNDVSVRDHQCGQSLCRVLLGGRLLSQERPRRPLRGPERGYRRFRLREGQVDGLPRPAVILSGCAHDDEIRNQVRYPRNMFDALVVGGGAMGSSIAYHLASDPNFTGRVVVVERDPTYARASSALSASSIRQQFSTPLNIHLSRYGIGFLRRASELLGVDLGLKEPGYLFLASAAGEAVLRANHAIQKGEGCAVELLDPRRSGGAFPGSPPTAWRSPPTARPTKAGSTVRR